MTGAGRARPAREAPLTPAALLAPAIAAMALALVEAGVAQVLFSRHEACVAASGYLRYASVPPAGCLDSEAMALVRGLSRGLIGAWFVGLPDLLAWSVGAALQGLMAAMLRTSAGRWWVASFFLAHTFLFVVAAAVAYVRQFIA
jgi:hypothetical protein